MFDRVLNNASGLRDNISRLNKLPKFDNFKKEKRIY